MKTFWRLVEESVLVSGLVALMMVVVACYLWVTGQEVPEPLFILLGTIIGFFYGAKVERRNTNEYFASIERRLRTFSTDKQLADDLNRH